MEDIRWYLPEVDLITEQRWANDLAKSLGVYLSGKGIRCENEMGERMTDDSFYVIFNAHDQLLEYTIPAEKCGRG